MATQYRQIATVNTLAELATKRQVDAPQFIYGLTIFTWSPISFDTAVPAAPKPKLEELPEFKSILQRELNRVNADEKRKNQELASQLKTLQQNNQLTEQEKADLQTQITRLEETYQTKEEQARIQLDTVQKELNNKLKTATEETGRYRGLYEQLLVSNDVAKAATQYEAHRIEQIEALLNPITKVVETLDPVTGKPTGKFAPQVTFLGRNSEGKDVELKITVAEAVKLMSEMTDKYGNLFKNKAIDGLSGGTNGSSTGAGKIPDVEGMDLATYRKNREKVLDELRKH